MPGSESQADLGNEFLPAGCFIPVGGRGHEMKKKKERKSLQTTLTLRRKRYQRQGENGVPACHSNLRWERCQAASWGQGRGQPSQEPTTNRNAPHSKSPSPVPETGREVARVPFNVPTASLGHSPSPHLLAPVSGYPHALAGARRSQESIPLVVCPQQSAGHGGPITTIKHVVDR